MRKRLPISRQVSNSSKSLPPQIGLQRQLDFWLKLGSALFVTQGLQSIEAETAYTRAAEIGEELGDGRASFQAKWGLWINANLRRKTALARDRANELVSLARQSSDRELLLEAYHCQLSTAHFRGDVRGVLEGSGNTISLYDVGQHRHLAHAFGGHDPCVCAHAQCGNAWQISGEGQQARQHFTQAIELAETLFHPNSTRARDAAAARMGRVGGEGEPAYAAAHRAAALANKFNLPPWRASSLILVGWATATGATAADAMRLIDAEIANATAVGHCLNIISASRRKCCFTPAGRRTRSVISTARSRASTKQASEYICLKSIVCAARAYWLSTVATRPKRDHASQPLPVLPRARAQSSSSVARRLPCLSLRHRDHRGEYFASCVISAVARNCLAGENRYLGRTSRLQSRLRTTWPADWSGCAARAVASSWLPTARPSANPWPAGSSGTARFRANWWCHTEA